MIYFFIGPSGSGKDTYFSYALDKFSFNPIVLYTTRPKRCGEKDGINYHFITNEKMEELAKNNLLIERRDYNTVHGIWTYATSSENLDIINKDYLTINTWEGYASFIKYYKNDQYLKPFYFQVDDGLRLLRAVERERNHNGKYTELCRRFLADEVDFDLKYLQEYNPIIIDNNGSALETKKKIDENMKRVLKRKI